MTIAVVILNYNGQKFLEQFLPDVVRYSAPHSVVVADNASTDNSIAYLLQNFPQIRLIQLEQNKGFSEGYNESLTQISADYYVLLNSDVAVTENWLVPVEAYLQKNPAIEALQPKIRAFHLPTHFEYAGAGGGFLDKWGYPFCRGRIFDTLEEDKGQYDNILPIFWASGACLIIKASAYHELGGLDADFFAHMEEIDLCWRIWRRAGKIIFLPESVVYHVGGGTLAQGNPRKTYLNFRNNLALLTKNVPFLRLVGKLAIRFCLDGVALMRFVGKGEFAQAKAILKAYWDFYRRFRFWRRKYSVFPQENKEIPIYPRSIVWQYYAKGKKKYSELPANITD
jgi:hypothetical protein